MHKNSISWEGVRLSNSLPESLKTFKGSKEAFKVNLDQYLEQILDQPEMKDMKPGGRDIFGNVTYSIADWPRTLGLHDYFLMMEVHDDSPVMGVHDDFPMHGHDELLVSNSTIVTGAGIIPSHYTCVKNFNKHYTLS